MTTISGKPVAILAVDDDLQFATNIYKATRKIMCVPVTRIEGEDLETVLAKVKQGQGKDDFKP